MIGKPTILITGATGRIGPFVRSYLENCGFVLRIASLARGISSKCVHWEKVDFRQTTDFRQLLLGVDIVVHMAAELWDSSLMEQVNVRTTRALCEAAEKEGVKLVIYTSTVGVYGHPPTRSVTEKTRTLSPTGADGSEFLGPSYLLDYCLSKLRGELAMQSALKETKSVILRLSNVTAESQIKDLFGWHMTTRIWRGYRRTHQIYVKNVAAAIGFFVERESGSSGSPSREYGIFNVSEDFDLPNRYRDFFRILGKYSGRGLWECPLSIPSIFDYLKDKVKFGFLKRGLPSGMACYSPLKLLRLGYRYPYSISDIQAEVIREATQTSQQITRSQS